MFTSHWLSRLLWQVTRPSLSSITPKLDQDLCPSRLRAHPRWRWSVRSVPKGLKCTTHQWPLETTSSLSNMAAPTTSLEARSRPKSQVCVKLSWTRRIQCWCLTRTGWDCCSRSRCWTVLVVFRSTAGERDQRQRDVHSDGGVGEQIEQCELLQLVSQSRLWRQ